MEAWLSSQILLQKHRPVNQFTPHVQNKFEICAAAKQRQRDTACTHLGVTSRGSETTYVQNQILVAQIDGQITRLFQTTLGASQASQAYFLDPRQNQ